MADDALPRGERRALVTEREMLLDHDRRLDAIEHWRAEIHGAIQLTRWTFGASILSAVVMIATLMALLSGKGG